MSVRDSILKLKEPQDHWCTQRHLTLKRFYVFTFTDFPIKYMISFKFIFCLCCAEMTSVNHKYSIVMRRNVKYLNHHHLNPQRTNNHSFIHLDVLNHLLKLCLSLSKRDIFLIQPENECVRSKLVYD